MRQSCQAGAVPLEPTVEAIQHIVVATPDNSLAQYRWDSAAEHAAGDCNACKAALVQLFQDEVESWPWQQ
jgi:hypothetical protein